MTKLEKELLKKMDWKIFCYVLSELILNFGGILLIIFGIKFADSSMWGWGNWINIYWEVILK